MRRSKIKGPGPENLLLNIAEVAEILSDLEVAHQFQLQFMKSLNGAGMKLFLYEGLDSDLASCVDALKRMDHIGKAIQTTNSSKIDTLFQRVGS